LARALIVGCGCRGRALGGALTAAGWAVRGTSRTRPGLDAIEAAGIEAAPADPDRAGTVVELVGDVAVVVWALGSASGPPELLDAIHGPRLERVLEHLVDTPVRGFVYEGAGSAGRERLDGGWAHVETASATWRIPARRLDADPLDGEGWVLAAVDAVAGVLGGEG
jgi:nucleoside-diphosphate-sugar epimerase